MKEVVELKFATHDDGYQVDILIGRTRGQNKKPGPPIEGIFFTADIGCPAANLAESLREVARELDERDANGKDGAA